MTIKRPGTLAVINSRHFARHLEDILLIFSILISPKKDEISGMEQKAERDGCQVRVETD
jgi:hypothetical protein